MVEKTAIIYGQERIGLDSSKDSIQNDCTIFHVFKTRSVRAQGRSYTF